MALIMANVVSLLGTWVAERFTQGVIDHAGTQLAYQMEALLEPTTRSLELSGLAAPESVTDPAIQKVLAADKSDRNVLALRIWRSDGTLAYDTLAGGPLAGVLRFPHLRMFNLAKSGEIAAARAAPDHELSQAISALYGLPILHVFAPLHNAGNGEVTAIVEYFQNATALNATIAQSRQHTWMLVAGSGLVIFLLMYALVHSGHGEILKESVRLTDEVAEQRRLTRESAEMRIKLQQANRLGTELNERYLRRISSDLHDGPAQHLALALLKIEDVTRYVGSGSQEDQSSAERAIAVVRQSTTAAMREIRNISTGLALPELNHIEPADALLMAVRAHERVTGTTVKCEIGLLPASLPLPTVICMFRFAQEGLNNAFRHANGRGQKLTAKIQGNIMQLEVCDEGPGFEPPATEATGERLGLTGLRQRVEALGGTFSILSQPDGGTRLLALFSLNEPGAEHA